MRPSFHDIKRIVREGLTEVSCEMELDDRPKVRGGVSIFIEEGGKRWAHWEKHNLVVNTGRQVLSHLLGDPAFAPLSILKLGTCGSFGSTPGVPGPNPLVPRTPSTSETTLMDPSPFVKEQALGSPFYLYALPQVYTKFIFCFEKPEGNGSGSVMYTEAGLFNTADYMFAIQTFPAVVKTAQRKIVIEWVVYF